MKPPSWNTPAQNVSFKLSSIIWCRRRIPRIPSPWKMWRIRKQQRRNPLKGRWVKTPWWRRSYQDRCCSGWHRDGDRAGDHPPHHGGRGRGQGHHHRRQARPQRVHLPTPRPAGGLVILALLAPHTNFPTISASLTDSNACAGALQQQVHRCGLHSLQRICALSGNNSFYFIFWPCNIVTQTWANA